MDKDKSSQPKVTLEKLLRLKRAERPPQNFWEEFERELRHRQLAAAIVENRPWWRLFTGGLAKIYVPAGAVAAVALAVVAMRSDRTAPPAAAGAAGPGPRDAAVFAMHDGTHGAGITSPASAQAPNEPAAPLAGESAAVASVRATPAAGAPQPRPDAQPSPVRVDADANTGMAALSGMPAVAAAFAGARNRIFWRQSFAALQMRPDPGNADGLAPASILTLFEPVTPPAETGADHAADGMDGNENNYLHRLASSSNPRSSRLLAYAEPVSEKDTGTDNNPRLARARERITSRLSDRALVDSSSRFAASDGMVSIKF
jgi:hypothetical protein